MNISRIPGNFVDTNALNGVPLDSTRVSFSSKKMSISKGGQNFIVLRPGVLTEHTANAGAAYGDVTPSSILGQIFAPSVNNITALAFNIETLSAGLYSENFESYANDTALQAAWVEITNAAGLEQTVISPNNSSTKSMRLPLNTISDEWVDTISSTSMVNKTFCLDYNTTRILGPTAISFFIGDGTNTKSIPLVATIVDTWQSISFGIGDLVEDGAGVTDETAITKVGFRVDSPKVNEFSYIDNLVSANGNAQLEIKLWDMGTTIPTSGVESLLDGTQYVTLGDAASSAVTLTSSVVVDAPAGRKFVAYEEFVAGVAIDTPNNVELNIGNFYAISLHYVNENIRVYGTNIDELPLIYPSGFGFITSDEASPMSGVNDGLDIQFSVFGMADEVFVTGYRISTDASPGIDAFYTLVQLGVANDVLDNLDLNEKLFDTPQARDLSLRPLALPAGGRAILVYDDDVNDSITTAALDMGFIYNPPITNVNPTMPGTF